MYKLFVVWVGKILLILGRLRGGGSALPGLVVEKLYPRFIEKSTEQLSKGVILVAGTNGKTTTTKMIARIFRDQGEKLLINTAGSNMPRGIIAGILNDMDWLGRTRAERGLFEVDEGFIPQVAIATSPKAILVLNLLRDQLDRYGELDRTASLIRESLGYTDTAILNADDPLVADLAESRQKILFFGASQSIQNQTPNDDALHHTNKVKKSNSKIKPDILLTKLSKTGEGQKVDFVTKGMNYAMKLKLPGAYNAYNAAATLTLALSQEVSIDSAISSLDKVEPAFGRSELIEIDGKKLRITLVKNPSGFNQVIETYLNDDDAKYVLIAINDNYADGRDVSWLWDVGIERLSGTKKTFYTTGVRGYDMALRLRYADIDSKTNTNLEEALDEFIKQLPDNATGYVVPTYTAMLALRKLISKKTKIAGIWQ